MGETYNIQRLRSPFANKRSGDGGDALRGRDVAIVAVDQEFRHIRRTIDVNTRFRSVV